MLTGTSENTSAPVQEAKTPKRGETAARATSSAILATEKTRFSSGTKMAARSPVRTLSWRLKTDHAIVAPTNQTQNQALEARKSRSGAHCRSPAREGSATAMLMVPDRV